VKQILLYITIFLSFSVSVKSEQVTTWGWKYDCGIVLEAFDDNFDTQITVFVRLIQGYISGVNIVKLKEVGTNVSEQTIKYALEKYCRDNPTKNTLDASSEIYRLLEE